MPTSACNCKRILIVIVIGRYLQFLLDNKKKLRNAFGLPSTLRVPGDPGPVRTLKLRLKLVSFKSGDKQNVLLLCKIT